MGKMKNVYKVGDKVNRLTLIGKLSNGKTVFVCECGEFLAKHAVYVWNGNTKSCGCAKRDAILKRNTLHGLSKLPEYSVWKDMKKRCYNPNNSRYKNYQEKGITVCDEWLNSFEKFLGDIGRRPTNGLWTIGRIDNTKGYFKENVEWQRLDTQARAHSLQSNNKTGHVGVVYVKCKKSKTTLGYESRVETYQNGERKRKSKTFLFKKYKENALIEAVLWRKEEIDKLKSCGIYYHESHGVPVCKM